MMSATDPFATYGQSAGAPVRRELLDPREIEDIRLRHALSDIIGRHTNLRRAGRELVGLCPFHPEKSPSFHVNDAKGFYHCFGCGAHGDAIRFLRDLEGLGFIEAVQQLAGSDLPVISAEDRVKAAKEDAAARSQAIADAKSFAARCVDPTGTAAEAYARSRGIVATLPESIRFGMLPAWRDSHDRSPWDRVVRLGSGVGSTRPSRSCRENKQDRMKHSDLTSCVKRFSVLIIRSMQMTPLQCRMARSALGWSIDKLAEASDMRAATVSSFERGGECYRSTVEKLQDALIEAGVIFIAYGEASMAGGAGVRLRP